MEKKGFIRREGVEGDARLKKLTLTEKGDMIIDLMAEDREIVEKTLVKGFTDEEILQFCAYIERMKQNIQGELNK
jgi:DNA-binding MarR family transcriptional regulator